LKIRKKENIIFFEENFYLKTKIKKGGEKI